MHLQPVPLIAAVFLFGAICQLIAWRLRIPPILFLLFTGILVGPLLGIVRPEALLGDLFSPFVSLSVAIILFEGSLNLRIREIRGLHAVVRNLVSFGMAITWLIISVTTRVLFDVSWEVSLLFGAIMVVSGPTVVAPILRTVRPVSSIGNILRWESIVIDPIGASLAILVFEFIVIGGGRDALGHTLVTFIELLVVGGAIGLISGYAFGICLKHFLIPEFLHNVCALAMVFASFALADFFQPESGLVTVTVFGVLLANMRGVDLKHILIFKETLSILLISVLFVLLAARIDIGEVMQLGWKAVLVCAVIQLLARPLCVMIATHGSALSRTERLFMAWIAPRGIVAAAIASLFALKLELYGYGEAGILVPLTFTVIMFTVIVQSLTAVPIAHALKVTLPDSDGFLIVSSNPVTRAIARKFMESDIAVMIADRSRRRRLKAEKEHIPTCRDTLPEEFEAGYFDEYGLGSLLALSADEHENIEATITYRRVFKRDNVYSILSSRENVKNHSDRAHRRASRLFGKTLFSSRIDYQMLLQMLENGAELHFFALERKLDPRQFHERCGQEAVMLFAFDTRNKAHCFSAEAVPSAEAGWRILYLGFEPPRI